MERDTEKQRQRDRDRQTERQKNKDYAHLHLVRLFWNQVFTWASVILSCLAREERSAEARYFWR